MIMPTLEKMNLYEIFKQNEKEAEIDSALAEDKKNQIAFKFLKSSDIFETPWNYFNRDEYISVGTFTGNAKKKKSRKVNLKPRKEKFKEVNLKPKRKIDLE